MTRAGRYKVSLACAAVTPVATAAAGAAAWPGVHWFTGLMLAGGVLLAMLVQEQTYNSLERINELALQDQAERDQKAEQDFEWVAAFCNQTDEGYTRLAERLEASQEEAKNTRQQVEAEYRHMMHLLEGEKEELRQKLSRATDKSEGLERQLKRYEENWRRMR
jgi:hypothetical protein